jgi:hypothetical protein
MHLYHMKPMHYTQTTELKGGSQTIGKRELKEGSRLKSSREFKLQKG